MVVKFNFPFAKRLEVAAFTAGFITLTFELVAARVVAPYLGATIYTWTSIIGVILAALAVGYIIGGIIADNRKQASDIVLLLLGVAISICVVIITKDSFLASLGRQDWALQTQAFFASLVLFAAPTLLLGSVTAYLARLSIIDVETSGHKLSRIEAAGTLGSLLGTFSTGYILFGLVGTRQLLVFLAVAAVLATFLIDYKKYLWLRAAGMIVVICSSFASSAPILSGYLKDIDTKYSRVTIRDVSYDNQSIRVLQTDSNYQSGVYNSGEKGLVFPYLQSFANASEIAPNTKRQLIVGGGAFTFPEYLAKQSPSATIDTVEIDEQLPKISRDYFKFRQPPNLKIIAADGRQFLNNTDQRYGAIYLDAFSSLAPPFQLLTQEATSKMKAALSADGLLVVNIIAAAEGRGRMLTEYTYSTYRSIFPNVEVYRVSSEYAPAEKQNLLILASNKPLGVDVKRKLEQQYSRVDLTYDKQQVMTDNYAPVEALAIL